MFFDSHVHIVGGRYEKAALARALGDAGVGRLILFSYPPQSFTGAFEPFDGRDRLTDLLAWADALPQEVYPFYWIDPMEEDAIAQVDRAVSAGVAGFKCICTYFNPGDERPMEVWRHIASTGKPLKFHSGILYAGGASSQYNRPVLFEPLLYIDGLCFCISHISWPWVDECLAVYGKWRSLSSRGLASAELFIDTTPGTPAIYREEALYTVYNIGYDIARNLTFGTDCRSNYNVQAARGMIERDVGILTKLGVPADAQQDYFINNLRRFVGAL